MTGFYTGIDTSAGTISSYADKTFYGFFMDVNTGKLTISVINDNSEVSLPQDNMTRPTDYQQFIWSSDALNFLWDSNGHLQVQFL